MNDKIRILIEIHKSPRLRRYSFIKGLIIIFYDWHRAKKILDLIFGVDMVPRYSMGDTVTIKNYEIPKIYKYNREKINYIFEKKEYKYIETIKENNGF